MNSKAFKLALIYDNEKRYIVPFDLAQKTLDLNDGQIKKLETAVLREVSKG